MALLLPEKIDDFFRDEMAEIIQRRKKLIGHSLRTNKNDLTQEFEYLVAMLSKFAVDVSYFQQHWSAAPLSDFIGLQQNKELTKINGLADFCLFRVGFYPFGFKRFDNRKIFIFAGERAYRFLGQKNFARRGDIFITLADNFTIFCNIFSEVGTNQNFEAEELNELAKFYYETGNPLAYKILFSQGVTVVPRGL